MTDAFYIVSGSLSYVLPCSIKDYYGRVFSMKIGSYRVVMASTSEAKEVLGKKSADYAGRPKTYAVLASTLG